MKQHLSYLPIAILACALSISSCNEKGSSSIPSSISSYSYYSLNEDYIELDIPQPSGEIVREEDIVLDDFDYHTAIQNAYLASSCPASTRSAP